MLDQSTVTMSLKAQTNAVSIAVVVPCHNEELTIANVVSDFQRHLPEAKIYVFDNRSTDKAAEVASTAGAEVRAVSLKGKGNVVRRMFADIDADIYIMLDGDDTYDVSMAPALVSTLLEKRLDMVVGARVEDGSTAVYRKGHRFGNSMLTGFVQRIFGGSFTDMLSGYRVFSRRFAKSFPAISRGFEIETELTIHALELRCPYAEIDTKYGSRPEGSASKLSTYRDGIKILKMIVRMYMQEKPIYFYGIFSLLTAFVAIVLSIPVFIDYFETGLVPRFPTAILSSALMVVSIICLNCALILDTVTKGRNEAKSLAYLSYKAPGQ